MNVDMTPWITRTFPHSPPPGEFAVIVERLRGTPARVEGKLAATPPRLLTQRPAQGWSIQEHVGHLLDLEPLWEARLSELLEGKDTLRAADMSNRATNEAGHNAASIVEIFAGFRDARAGLVERLDALSEDDVVRSALHPRLKQPMRLIDLCLFVAEHDDHHLATITRLWHTLPPPPAP